jgi:hypothetical protein
VGGKRACGQAAAAWLIVLRSNQKYPRKYNETIAAFPIIMIVTQGSPGSEVWR